MFINTYILSIYDSVFVSRAIIVCLFCSAGGPPAARRGRAGGYRGRGQFPVRREGPMKFEKDFDFESANAQFTRRDWQRVPDQTQTEWYKQVTKYARSVLVYF